MSDKKQLNEEQLEKVNGGGSYASDKHLPINHGPHLNAAELYQNKNMYVGQQMYCIFDSYTIKWAIVTLNNVYKKRGYYYYWENVTVNKIGPDGFTVDHWNKAVAGKTYDINAAEYTMYALEPGNEAIL